MKEEVENIISWLEKRNQELSEEAHRLIQLLNIKNPRIRYAECRGEMLGISRAIMSLRILLEKQSKDEQIL